jgi:hypothetical protein
MATIGLRDRNGRTAYQVAARLGHEEAQTLLVRMWRVMMMMMMMTMMMTMVLVRAGAAWSC